MSERKVLSVKNQKKAKVARELTANFIKEIEEIGVHNVVLTFIKNADKEYAINMNGTPIDPDNEWLVMIIEIVRAAQNPDILILASTFIKHMHVFMKKAGAQPSNLIEFHKSVIEVLSEAMDADNETASDKMPDEVPFKKPVTGNGDNPTIH